MNPGGPITTSDLKPGVRIFYFDVTCTILRDSEPHTDRFGRSLLKFWARREDTCAEGYLIFGDGAVIQPSTKAGESE